MTDLDLADRIAASHERWRTCRRYLNERRHELSEWAARNLHADHSQVGTTGFLTRAGWLPQAPIPLENVTLRWCETTPPVEVDGTEPASAGVRPLRGDGQPFATYAEALGELARPRLFEDRPCYRLLDLAVEDGKAQLSFGTGAYFDVMNVSEAVAHELAAVIGDSASGSASLNDLPLRSLVGDPCDLQRRAILPAISALTIRRTATDATFVLHWRDSAKVAHGGGLYQVMPVGMFQPSADGAWNRDNDFDLWRCLAREYSEEFLGTPEHPGDDGPLDYANWPFYRTLTEGREAGKVTAHWLGVRVDPMKLVTDLLVAVVYDDDAFDALFGNGVAMNAEGHVAGHAAGEIGEIGLAGVSFTQDQVQRLAASEPMQAAGAALLTLAWEHRSRLLA